MGMDLELSTDRASIVVPPVGRLVETDEEWEPYRLVDGEGFRCRGGRSVVLRVAGRWAVGGHVALVRDGPVAVVPVPVGRRGAMGPGDARRSS